LYVVERVVFDVGTRPPATFWDWTGSNGDHTGRVPVAAFADRGAAEAAAARLEREEWAAVGPARFGSELGEPSQSAVREILRRHGFNPPDFYSHPEHRSGVPFPVWWQANAHRLTPAIATEVGAAFGDGARLYRVEARELVED
jgi:hypothetical protein